MKVALIGAGSSVGRHILAGGDARFIGIYRSAKSLSQLCDLGVGRQLVKVSFSADLASAVSGCDAVVTLVNDTNPAAARNSLQEVNEACVRAKVGQLIHLSSAAIYGARPSDAEDSASSGPPLSWNPYSVGKHWQEVYLKGARSRPPSTVVLRPGLIWGPGMAWFHIPAGDLVRGEAWVAEGDAKCNLVNINLLVHAILGLVDKPPTGLSFVNIRDAEELSWSTYYQKIAAALGLATADIAQVPRSTRPWAGQPRAFASIFPIGLGWSVLPKPAKTVIKTVVGSVPRSKTQTSVALIQTASRPSINREVWELKTADGLPPLDARGRALQASYSRTPEEDWKEVRRLRPWMLA